MSDDVVRLPSVGSHVHTVVLAFAADPFVRWFLPDPSDFVEAFTAITHLHAERTVATGGAYGRADGRSAAFWYRPGVHVDHESFDALLRDVGATEQVAAVFESAAAHVPDDGHFYLRQIGVDPPLRGRGEGTRLLVAGLADVDREHGTAYLEATSNSSRVLYERHGFVTLAEVTAGGSPPLWPMVRRPR